MADMQSPDPSNSRKTTEIKRSDALEALIAQGVKDTTAPKFDDTVAIDINEMKLVPMGLAGGEKTAPVETETDNKKVKPTLIDAAVPGASTDPSGPSVPADAAPSRPSPRTTQSNLAPISPLAPTSLSDPNFYINRELSLLAFQWRVLEEAFDENNPLLERFRFLSIVGSNLEEFFMVRVAGLKRQIESGSTSTGPDGLSPTDQLDAVSSEVTKLFVNAQQCLRDSLLPGLAQQGVQIQSFRDLPPEEKEEARELFKRRIFPVLTPLAYDPGHPFPHISNLSLNLAVLIRDLAGQERFARVKIPPSLPQLVAIGKTEQPVTRPTVIQNKGTTYVWLEELIRANLDLLFPGMEILEAYPFHVTRDAEMEIQEWEAGDLLENLEEGVKQRRFGDVVRLEVHHAMPANLLEILMSNLQIDPNDVYLVDGCIPLSSLKHVANLDRADLKYPTFTPSVPASLDPESMEQEEDIFAAISKRNIVLHHPYDSFQPVINFLQTAARDPKVLAIKMTLYRVGKNSPVVEALLKAQENGKQVAVLVELKARFDEESNIEWAKALEAEGVHVVYGLVGLKIHSKVALVVRKEGDAIKRYVHLGTGNYNPLTAHLYTDIGLFTCNDDIGSDVTDLFNYLTGYSAKRDYRKILVAPINLRDRFEFLIRREIDHARKGEKGRIILKMNSLVDERIIRMLYEASQAGVKVDLIVRGTCCLRPGLPGVSDNIRVISVIGRFLEHSRIYYFRNAGKEEIFCGSADMMPRNLNRRVEVIYPVTDERIASYLEDAVLKTYLADTSKARIMQPDGRYTRVRPSNQEPGLNCQQWFLSHTSQHRR